MNVPAAGAEETRVGGGVDVVVPHLDANPEQQTAVGNGSDRLVLLRYGTDDHS